MVNKDSGNENGDLTQVSLDIEKEKRKIYNRDHYKRRSAQNKKQKVVNSDVSLRVVENHQLGNASLKIIANPFPKRMMLSTNDASTSYGPTVINKENVAPHCNAKLIEARKEVNRNYYLRSKEKKRMLATYRLQVYHEALSTVGQENTQICSGITQETSNDAGGCSEVHENPMVRDVIIREDPHDSVFYGIPEVHRVLGRSTTCVHCGAKRFKFEFATFCCMSGKTKLATSYIPPELYRLFTLPDELGKMFRKNIRAYNTNFSFTSMGVTLDKDLSNMKSGVYTFRANGGIYHNIDQLVGRDGTPRYLQLYFYDSETDFTHRLRFENIDKEIIQKLTNVLAPNPYVKTF